MGRNMSRTILNISSPKIREHAPMKNGCLGKNETNSHNPLISTRDECIKSIKKIDALIKNHQPFKTSHSKHTKRTKHTKQTHTPANAPKERGAERTKPPTIEKRKKTECGKSKNEDKRDAVI